MIFSCAFIQSSFLKRNRYRPRPPNATFPCTPYWNIGEENGTANVKVVNEINMAVRVWRLRDLNVIISFITLLLFLSSCKYEQNYYNLWVWFEKLSTIDNTSEILTNLSPVMLYFCKQRPIHIFLITKFHSV